MRSRGKLIIIQMANCITGFVSHECGRNEGNDPRLTTAGIEQLVDAWVFLRTRVRLLAISSGFPNVYEMNPSPLSI